MKSLKKNGARCQEMNVIVFADDGNLLWDTRNMFFQIREEKGYLLHVTLTKYFSTLLEVSEFISGGVDLIYFTVPIPERITLELQQIAERQDAAGLIIYETDGILWEYYQNGQCMQKRHIPVKDVQALYGLTEALCDYIAGQAGEQRKE